ncbi:TPA: hypothetical protein DEP34_02800 [Candidatus Uhrbacteria bacterium]|uniref:Uncharacterized protein n=2 Tax=Candidatus Uhriibacteriota TaxID=1752732 RepID=A0A0G1Q8P4_9BACT|nr:MAG: hypothetical protein UX45_C0001G0005 [Candidatus Uhrbacteria bacterium GW2011_GWF2_46_218]KKU41431.1 MAG: hypothetical protein UX57_C0004G0135 [Candidatus Uhrbacteria bacterium GW2011_GWE2_46_68]HBK33869.1 hypothetical protein [Candidatus Uhrbacteria bacterium]HCB19291.1 hypothetical protein [Candidatus Uhrbacteria bacterium]
MKRLSLESAPSFPIEMRMASFSRSSLPEPYRDQFDFLRQEIIDFAASHGIPREALAKPDLLREAANKLPTPDLERLAVLLERFKHLIVHREPYRETQAEILEYAETFYNLREQYTLQCDLFKRLKLLQVGYLSEPVDTERTQGLSALFRSLLPFGKKKRVRKEPPKKGKEFFFVYGIDGKQYTFPTLEEVAERLYRQQERLHIKRDQGFTKLLLVPFGMRLEDLFSIYFRKFLTGYQEAHPNFGLKGDGLMSGYDDFVHVDRGSNPRLFYYPRFFRETDHQGKTKPQILRERVAQGVSCPGWNISLFQPLEPDDLYSKGFASISRHDYTQGKECLRPCLSVGRPPHEYLSLLEDAKANPDSPYHGETGMTPEDWITAFMVHLEETGRPLDDFLGPGESEAYLLGSFFPANYCFMPYARWDNHFGKPGMSKGTMPAESYENIGARFLVQI